MQRPLGLLILLCGETPAVWACPYIIREAGFVVRDPRPYRACVCSSEESGGTEGLLPQVEAMARKLLAESNVTAEVVNINQQTDHPAAQTAALLHPLPATILISPEGQTLSLRPPGSEPTAVESDLEATVHSPLRDKLRDLLIDRWCVFVLKESGEREPDSRAHHLAESAAQAAVGMTGEMGHVIHHPPAILAVPGEEQGERVLLWSLGLLDREGPGIAVVFGRGRRLGPVLWHAEITREALLTYVRLLGYNCTCTSDPSQILGPTVPMVWDELTVQRIREMLGFDPESPQVRNTLAGVWTMLPMGSTSTDIGDLDPGYIEIPISFEETPQE
ncbi:MAG: hypothetical protein ACUVX8_09455 [Candidatus Zipacnadales bacterium]